MNRRKWWALPVVAALCLSLVGCQMEADVGEEAQAPASSALSVEKATVPDVDDVKIADKKSLYAEYDPLEVPCFYVTVRKGTAADGTDHTFEEVNAYTNLQGQINEKVYADALVQVGDETGPLPGELGYDSTEPNATINVRGRTSTTAAQKSYRLSLNDNAGLWYGQRAIALNKHPSDTTRMRNMLYFTLLQDVPDMLSLRTRFVHLYVKDETSEPKAEAFEDYGLFTQVELPNNRYLRNHELSRDGGLYKASMCEMYRYPDAIRLATDPLFDQDAFDLVMEPKVTNNHEKLIEMLDAVNNYDLGIEEVIDKYFDLDNLTSFIAYNILLGNMDTSSQNYYLYNPVGSDTWYYLCWDGDDSLIYHENQLRQLNWTNADWMNGVSNYWGVVLFNRMLRVQSYRTALAQKMEQIRSIVTPQRVAELVASFRTVVDPYTARMPDALYMRAESAVREQIYATLPDALDANYNAFLASLQKPMPYYLGDAVVSGGQVELHWEASYDFDGEFVYYTIQVATDWSFAPETIVFEAGPQLNGTVSMPRPSAGVYYWRVTAKNESGFTQMAFDQVSSSTATHNGMRRFTVNADGTVTNNQ